MDIMLNCGAALASAAHFMATAARARLTVNMLDRFVIAAVVDRLIYDNDDTFGTEDARVLLDALPRTKSPWIQLGVAGQMSGGSSRGFAAGVGDVQVEDERKRQFEFTTGGGA